MRQKHELAKVLGIEPSRLRVLSFDVGGNFGARNRAYVEFGLVLWASKKVGLPVKFTATRSEAFLTDYQGRDLVTKVELALRRDGPRAPAEHPGGGRDRDPSRTRDVTQGNRRPGWMRQCRVPFRR